MVKKCFLAALLLSVWSLAAAPFTVSPAGSDRVKVNGFPVIVEDTVLAGDVRLNEGDGKSIRADKTGSVSEWESAAGKITRQLLNRDKELTVQFDYALQSGTPVITLTLPLTLMNTDAGTLARAQVFKTVVGDLTVDPAGSDGEWTLEKNTGSYLLRFTGKNASGKAVLQFKYEQKISDIYTFFPLVQEFTRPRADNAQLTGWTGQGASNDLSTMPSGILYSDGVPFDVTDRAVLLRSGAAPTFPISSGKMKAEKPVKIHTFYFLQTAAWSAGAGKPVANYLIHYSDGTTAEIPVRYSQDIADWWACIDIVNAKVAWVGPNSSGQQVCVYSTRAANPHPEKEVAAVELITTQTLCIAAMLAVTGVNDTATAAVNEHLTSLHKFKESEKMQDTSKWPYCAIAWNGTIEPGSALDFSFMNHKPAGKYGYLKRVGDQFEFEGRPGEPVKFWGTNFAIEGPFPAKDLAPGIARTMAAQGVNMVRFHLFAAREYLLQSPDGGFNPEMLDKMFFLFSELKKNGIYIYMDINDTLCYDWLLNRDRVTNPQERQKAFSIFDPELRGAVRKFTKMLFSVKNPYTNLTFAEDPAMAICELMNEHAFLSNWTNYPEIFKQKGNFIEEKLSYRDHYAKVLTELWENWLKKNGHPVRPLPTNFDADPVSRKFGAEMDIEYNREMTSLLRELGVKVPVCGVNLIFTSTSLYVAKESSDLIGGHDYYGNSVWGSRSYKFNNNAALNKGAWGTPLVNNGLLGNVALKGFPVVNGEWNYCYPNSYRCEAMPTALSIAAYQNWAGMIFYGATGSCDSGNWERFRKNPGIMIHSQQCDPSTWGVAYLGASLLRRGDVRPAGRQLPIVMPHEAIWQKLLPAQELAYAFEMGKVTIEFGDKGNWMYDLIQKGEAPAKRYEELVARIGDKELSTKQVISDTRELIRLPEHPLFLINTGKTQSITGRLAEAASVPQQLRNFRISSTMEWGNFSAISIDGKDLKDSSRILLIAVANSANSGEKIKGKEMFDMGAAPVKTQPFTAEITYLSDSKDVKVYVLESNTGKRIKELPVSVKDGGVAFVLDGKNPTIYYEIVK